MSTATATDFVELTTPHMPQLFRIGMRLTHQPSESQDLVQEALTKAWASWGRFNRDGSLGAWLSRILVNTFISRCRHQKVVNTAAARSDLVEHLFDVRRLEAANDPEHCWHRDDLSDEVVSALDTLPDRFREVVELVDLQGLPYREAAQQLQCPVGTVMSRLHRARRLLRSELGTFARGYGLGLAASA